MEVGQGFQDGWGYGTRDANVFVRRQRVPAPVPVPTGTNVYMFTLAGHPQHRVLDDPQEDEPHLSDQTVCCPFKLLGPRTATLNRARLGVQMNGFVLG